MKNFELRNNPELQSLMPEYPGNTFYMGQYKSDEPRIMPTWKIILKWFFSVNPQWREKKRDPFQVELIKNENFMSENHEQMIWLGHASFLIKINGKTIITDPCLRNLPLKKRKVGLPLSIEQIKGLDYILISHAHRDHLDLPTLKKLIKNNPEARILTGLGISGLFPKPWRDRTQEAGWYQIYSNTDNIKITYLPAQHWNRRFLTDLDKQLWGSFLIQSSEKTIYFAGDTAFGNHFDKIRFLVNEIDHCIIPIGAYKPDFIMKGLHLNPNEAILAFKILGGKNFIPMHYGTFDLSDEPAGEPVRIISEAKERNIFSGRFHPLAVGESYLL